MFSFWRRFSSSKTAQNGPGVLTVAKEQLKEHRDVIESLRDYDEGKKDIHTADLEQHLNF